MKMINYFRSICTIMIQEKAFNFGYQSTVVEMGAVVFEEKMNERNIQVRMIRLMYFLFF